ncbi:hypothetical protein NY547_10945 [Cnuibacter physcomitrellae]|uniref:beta strand repeat-containing protein n=1 Tax=Cnuibacter physcomitrellae TaxID=1619308 RepID=UPI002175FB90|nr:hypothetical protein [Cnuibacter physcomitrellae]MCS5497753.1 hypothetical protein [Cnuibacter physcomitrellae]
MTRSASVRRRALGGGAGVALAVAALIAVPVAPVFAATATVSTLAELKGALADCTSAPNTIALGADISAPGAALTVPCDTTIDLGTHDLSVLNVVIAEGEGLTVDGPTDGSGGTLTADATNAANGTAGIQTTGATLTVTGGTVTARGADTTGPGIGGDRSDAGSLVVAGGVVNAYADGYSAAVGGGYPRSAGGSVTITSGALNAYAEGPYTVAVGGAGGGATGNGGAGAQVTVTGGSLTASASREYGTAIGGGVAGLDAADLGGAGGSLTIGAGAEVTATAPRNAIGSGWDVFTDVPTGDFGAVDVDGTLRLPSGGLYIGTDAAPGPEITVGTTGRIVGSTADPATGAGISGPGSIDNQGAITLDPPSGAVTGNNRLVRFTPTAPSVRVFAPSFVDGARTLPAPPTGTQWNTAADGSGDWFTATSSTAGSGTLDLSAVVPGTIVVSTDPAALTATAGEPYDFPVTVTGPTGAPLAPQPTVDYTSTDCTIGAGGVFTVARSCSITASTTVQGVPLSKTFTIQVVAGPLAALTLTPASATVTQGASLAFLVSGVDAEGNAVDVTAAVLTSSSPADTVAGRSVTFSGAGAHTVTATLGSVSTTAAITVVAGPLSSLSITPSTTTVTQGGTVAFTVTGADAAGNPVDASAAVLTSSGTADAVDGHAVTFSGAGARTVTAALAGVTTTASVEVVAGPLATLTITPSSSSVDQGGTLDFTVSGTDAAGNPVDTSDAVLTSSVATDVVSGLSVTFPHASPHTITATIGAVSTSVTIQVVSAPAPTPGPSPAPATAPAGLANTGADGGAAALAGGTAVALLLLGGVLLLIRRSVRRVG